MWKLFALPYKFLGFWSYRILGFPRLMPINYTFSITNKCNSRCMTCKIWEHPIDDELSLEEWLTVIKSIGKPPIWITLSGGEPFIFQGVDQIIKAVFFYNVPKLLVIPTNGLLSTVIRDKLSKALECLPKQTTVTINVSLDGIGVDHDNLRGIKGNFERVKTTLSYLKELKKDFPTLVVGIHTVLSKWNIDKVKYISDYVWKNFMPDHHIFEIAEVRKEMFNSSDAPTPSVEQYQRFLDFWLNDPIVSSARKNLRGVSRITDFFRARYYDYLLHAVFQRDRKALSSFASFANIHISPNGDVWDCAVYADNMGNLRDYGLDFRRFWLNSPFVKQVQGQVKKQHLCPLANENYVNFLLSPWELFL